MISTINVGNSGFRTIIWLPLNKNKWFNQRDSIDIPYPKKQKEKKTKQLYKYVFFPWGIKVHPQVLYVHIALERNAEHVQKSNDERSLHPTETFSLKILLGCFAFWNVGTQISILYSKTKNIYFYYGTFNEIKSLLKTNRQIPSRK